MNLEVLIFVVIIPILLYRMGLARGKQSERDRIYKALNKKYTHMCLGTFNACVGEYEDLIIAQKLKSPRGLKRILNKLKNKYYENT
jgi:hypothetical protein